MSLLSDLQFCRQSAFCYQSLLAVTCCPRRSWQVCMTVHMCKNGQVQLWQRTVDKRFGSPDWRLNGAPKRDHCIIFTALMWLLIQLE